LPDTRTHRGPDPRDAALFGPDHLDWLRAATIELSWLLDRGYATPSSLKLVGDRWSLTERQRMAVLRSACPDSSLAARACHRVEPEEVAGEPFDLDGFNLLTTIEAALGGAVVLIGRDGCLRDIAGLHGTYRSVEETLPALVLTGETLVDLGVRSCTWHLDRPVSNSGRLRVAVLAIAQERGWDWSVELDLNPDPVLIGSSRVVASADSAVLDRCARWVNLARLVVEARIPDARAVNLSS
jgi:hypothetical protein